MRAGVILWKSSGLQTKRGKTHSQMGMVCKLESVILKAAFSPTWRVKTGPAAAGGRVTTSPCGSQAAPVEGNLETSGVRMPLPQKQEGRTGIKDKALPRCPEWPTSTERPPQRAFHPDFSLDGFSALGPILLLRATVPSMVTFTL